MRALGAIIGHELCTTLGILQDIALGSRLGLSAFGRLLGNEKGTLTYKSLDISLGTTITIRILLLPDLVA